MTEAVYHLITPALWAEARAAGEVAPRSLTTEGFVHCSTAAQVPGSIERHFAGVDELVLLRLDPHLGPELVWEESRHGERYPHLYRAITVREVVEAIPWHRGG